MLEKCALCGQGFTCSDDHLWQFVRGTTKTEVLLKTIQSMATTHFPTSMMGFCHTSLTAILPSVRMRRQDGSCSLPFVLPA